jgi:hypothetical protein
MTIYPTSIDNDTSITRVDDNITEVGGEAINQCREAIFAIETALGIDPSGSLSSTAERIDVSLNANGTIKTSALTSVGLVTLPIDNADVGTNAGIEETKLALNHTTNDLHTLILANTALYNSLLAFATTTFSDLNSHISGATFLSDGSSSARHVGSHIDVNAVPFDLRDVSYIWTGLQDKDGVDRPGTTLMEVIDEINTDLVTHENSISEAHVASAISVDTDEFVEIPQTADDVQAALQAIDDFEIINIGEHRATKHANAIPRIARSETILADGYGQNIVPSTPVDTFLVHTPNTSPVDSISVGDDLVAFQPVNTNFVFDSQFSQVKIGDIIRINYGNGVEASYPIDSIRYGPGNQWVVRLNGVNLYDSDGYTAFARIDRPEYDVNTAGILAVAAANAPPAASFSTIMPSAVVADPRGAMGLGLGFDANQVDGYHYNLYLELYPTGNPADHVITLPAIDVSGNAGATPGDYTLETVVQETNNSLRTIGYNYRFIAFAYEGNFGIMLADSINGASMAIISGVNSNGTLIEGSFTNNIIGDAVGTGFDALGLGNTHANIAGPTYIDSFSDATSAQLPTKVIVPLRNRNYIVNGRKRDTFASTYNANDDGYWDGYISARTVVGALTVETTYTLFLDLKAAGLQEGMTLVIQPTIDFANPLYSDTDYGRFIIKEVFFPKKCAGESQQTIITVINGIHATGTGVAASGVPALPVEIYFSESSVTFNQENIINNSPTTQDYRRFHEIFIDEDGKTFSHERARMPVQSEGISPPLLRTNFWHIINVSPKLRGYRDNTTTFNKYIRLYILSYDTTSGEFDGYIGQRSPTTDAILNVGPLTSGRKDVVTRFYDETNIDYIELKFIDTANAGPVGDYILSDGVPGGGGADRYVDIEIFDSLMTDDEFLVLATCEVNWDPIVGQDKIEHVLDRRQFGSVDETDFTTSALDYIAAGDRHLHQNGVIRGLDFDYIDSADNRLIYFKGGVALVNGAISTVNNSSITIPEIYDADGGGLPQAAFWAICVNEKNTLEAIPVTAAKSQLFATDGTTIYYIPSVTITELVNDRKDLTLIYIVVAQIASVTITDDTVLDARKFIESETANIALTISSSDIKGNFHSFDALKNYMQFYSLGAGGRTGNKFFVRVRGDWTVASTIDLTSDSIPEIIYDADGATFNVTADQGFLIDDNVTLKNFNFTYNPTGISFGTNDKINSANGCIYVTEGTDVENVCIENCVFTSTLLVGDQRPPFISVEMNNGDTVDNLKVLNCRFNDTDVNPAQDQAAVAIISKNDTGSGPAIVRNVLIDGNICNRKQGIYITIESAVAPVVSPGLITVNTVISRNQCGVIGFLSGMAASTDASMLSTDANKGLTIENNSCSIIARMVNCMAPLAGPGTWIYSDEGAGFGCGSVSINNNSCNWIILALIGESTNEYSQVSIDNNKLTAFSSTYFAEYYTAVSDLTGTILNSAILVTFDSVQNVLTRNVISNNIISTGYHDATSYYYDYGIYHSMSGTICNNIVRGIATNGYGIYMLDVGILSGATKIIIQGNNIDRESRTITNYIRLGTDDSRATGLCVDNAFDTFTVDGASTAVINATKSESVITERNKNQTDVFYPNGSAEVVLINIIRGDNSQHNSYIQAKAVVSGDYLQRYTLDSLDNGNEIVFEWIFELFGRLPYGVLLTEVAATVKVSAGDPLPATTKTFVISAADGSGTGSSGVITLSAVNQTATLDVATALGNELRVLPSNSGLVTFTTTAQHNAAADIKIEVSGVTFTYRW